MHAETKIRPGTGGSSAGEIPAGKGGQSVDILPQPARRVNPHLWEDMERQAADRVTYHQGQAAYHRERAARWLEYGHLSPFHAAHYREHMDAAAWHETLAERHAQVGATLEAAAS